MTLAYNDSDSKWSAEKLQKFDDATKSYADFKLAEDEELNNETLNALKTALDDLQIVDVVRKPQGLSNDLKAGADFMNNVEALQNLVSKGFIPAQAPGSGGAEELISSDGEVIATMKNGTEYVLRFGNLTNVGTEGGQTQQTAAAGADAAGEDKDGGVHRYLFVMARFNEGAVKRPELQELPELPAQATETPADPAAASEAAAKEDAEPAGTTSEATEAADTDDAATEATAATEKPKADATADEPKAEESNDTDAAKTDETEAAAAAGDETKPANEKEEEVKNIIAERTRIEQENKRKLDEYQQSLEKGRENVKDLNLRFGDWYFVVADDVFKKIRLSSDNIVKKKEKKTDAAAGTPTTGETPSTTTPSGIPGLPPIPGATQ